MGEHLVFLLHAPLGAMGGVAVGERRTGFNRPGKSAIVGLVAAGLGTDRSDEAAHTALADGYGLGRRFCAMRACAPSSRMFI
jgi:CRISPR system Cascade subunit CasD